MPVLSCSARFRSWIDVVLETYHNPDTEKVSSWYQLQASAGILDIDAIRWKNAM
jgi:hypothetical protein